MGSGSFSLEVGGPRIAPGRSDGVPEQSPAQKASCPAPYPLTTPKPVMETAVRLLIGARGV